MEHTTIRVTKSVRDRLEEERLPNESNYSDTLNRLLGDNGNGQLWTEKEIQDMINTEIENAQRY